METLSRIFYVQNNPVMNIDTTGSFKQPIHREMTIDAVNSILPSRLMALKNDGFVKIGRFDGNRTSWSVNYLKGGPLSEIRNGSLKITGYEWDGGPAILEYESEGAMANLKL